jgi:hypothetical protein
MAEIKVLKVENGYHSEHDDASDSLKMSSLLTANHELTDTLLGQLVSGIDANDIHIHDARYFRESEFINTSAGAGDAGKPITLGADGKIDESMIDDADITVAHDDTTGAAGSTIHTAFPLLDGTRTYTGNQDMGGNLITGLGTPVNGGDAARKSYVDAVAVGLRVKGNVRVATTTNISIATAPSTIDGVTLTSGDRVLVKDQTTQTENGIYDFNGAGSALTRSEDFDNSPLGEVYNGSFIPLVLEGSTNADDPYVLTSVGTGADGLHQLGTDNLVFEVFSSPSALTGGNGIDITSNVVSADLLASGGLKFVGDEIAVEPTDFAGEGLIDDGSDNLAIDWSTSFNDAKAIKAEDLASTANGEGASIIGIEDAGAFFTATDVEGALQELAQEDAGDGVDYTVGTGGVSAGDLLYVSGNNTVLPLDITTANAAIGVAATTEVAGQTVKVLANDTVIESIFVGATAGTRYFWNGTGYQTTVPTGAGNYVWLGGVAKNSTDAHVQVTFIKRNAV